MATMLGNLLPVMRLVGYCQFLVIIWFQKVMFQSKKLNFFQ